MNMIFLVDGDNNIGTGLQGIDLLTADDTVLVFYGKGQSLSSVQKLCAGTKAQVQYLESVRGGKNSIDFQIITELGVLVGRGEADFAYVISQDKGYEAAMGALRARYADTFREVALRPLIPACQQSGDGLGGRGRLSIEDVVGGSIQQLTEHPETVQTDAGVAGFQISEERYRQLGFLCKDFPCPALVFPRFSEPKAHVNFFRVLFPHTIDAPAYHDEEIVPYLFINQNTI